MNVWTLVPHANLDPTDEQMAPYEKLGPQGPAKERGFSTPRQIYYAAVTDAYIIYPWELDRGPEALGAWN